MGEATRRKRAALSPDRCEIPDCGWPHQIQRHRIVRGEHGGKYKKGNVISLCPNHHWLADRLIIAPAELLRVVAFRIEAEKGKES